MSLRAEADDVLHRDFVTLVEIGSEEESWLRLTWKNTFTSRRVLARLAALAKRGFAVDARAACALSGHRGGHLEPHSRPAQRRQTILPAAAVRADFTSCVSRLRFFVAAGLARALGLREEGYLTPHPASGIRYNPCRTF